MNERNERMGEFLKQLMADAQLQHKLESCASEDEAFAIVRTYVEGVEKDEVVSFFTELKESVVQEISLDDLQAAAGGDDDLGELWEETGEDDKPQPSQRDSNWLAIGLSASGGTLLSAGLGATAAAAI